jgi:hypothetical protein
LYQIYDKGTGITKYSDMPEEYMFDINKMEYKNEYKKVWEYNDEEGQRVYTNRKLSDDTKKLITEFKSLILKWERIVNNMNTMGDGTKETEQAAEQQMKDDKLEKVIEKVTKKVIKPILVTDRKSILTGDVLTFNYHGGYWLVTEVYSNNKDKTCISYENLGSASRGYQQLKSPQRYYDMEERILKGIEKGTIKIYTLQEVEEVTEVEKWIRKKPANNKTEQKPENKPDEKGEKPISNNSETITEQASKRQLWALHCATKLNTTNLIISREKASELIDRSMKGENITDKIKEMLNNKAA